MAYATPEFLSEIDSLAEARKRDILNAADKITVSGKKYYVSADGNDLSDGLTEKTAWRTLERVSSAELSYGDGVFFRRGDTFRGSVKTRSGVTYAAYGEGEKPKLFGWDKNLADEALWTLVDGTQNIWRYGERILDPGTLVFNEGERHSRKLIPSYIGGRFVCRDDEEKLFDMVEQMTLDLDLYWYFEDKLTTRESRGETFPIPDVDGTLGEVYLRCDGGNPAAVFSSIEALTRRAMFKVGDNKDVHIDNICMKYVGLHAVAAGGHSVGLHVTNCEIGWIGGTIQHYYGTDPNYPEGGRGTVTRFGNGVEVYGGCEDYEVSNCYIYQVYDAGMTHQITTGGKKTVMDGVVYRNNLVERCVYSIEYFLEITPEGDDSYMKNIVMDGNILRFAGEGWGQQRHNKHTPAHIKGWSYVNRASDYHVTNNIFDRCAYRLLHLVAWESESCPEMNGNTYIQYDGGILGQYGGNKSGEPEVITANEEIGKTVSEVLGDKNAVAFVIKN